MKKSILDSSFKYVPSGSTNIRETFRLAQPMKESAAPAASRFEIAWQKFLATDDAKLASKSFTNEAAMHVAFLAGIAVGMEIFRDIYNSAPKEK